MRHCMRHRRERWRSAVSYNVAPMPSPCESPSPSPSPSPSHSPTLFLTLTLTGKARDERRGIALSVTAAGISSFSADGGNWSDRFSE